MLQIVKEKKTMDNLEGFTPIFDDCRNKEKQDFDSFRSDPAFYFLAPFRNQVSEPDTEALEIAKEQDEELFHKYMGLSKPKLGYADLEFCQVDTVDCRHIMMSTLIFKHLKDVKSVVEIGGGFGNWARINLQLQDIDNWSIVDLDFVLELQKWFLQNSLDEDLYSKVSFIEAGNEISNEEIDLVIGAHSLSEISLDLFIGYLPTLKKAKYLFYARHKGMPSVELSNKKLDTLLTMFDIIENVESEGGHVNNYLMKRKGTGMQTIDLVATDITPKKKLKIAVYGISKNEEKFIARWAQSAKEADLILLADTGSDDRTVEIAKENGVEVHHIFFKPWRFDHARNASLALIPGDFDVCVSLDVDEVLEPGWREEIERLWEPDTTRMRYIFDWGHGKKFYHVKIHSRQAHFWKHACHEVPVTDMRVPEKFCFTDKQMVTHYPDHTKSRAQYFDILKVAVDEDPSCPRNAFYWARELSYYSKWEEALVALNKYLSMPSATWNCERCYAYITMSRCYSALGNPAEAEKSLLKAAMEAPETREPWVALADLCYQQHRWPECYAYAMKAVNITYRANNYTEDPNCWGWRPHDFAAIAAFRLGLKDQAIEQGQIAVDIEPTDERLRTNLKWYKNEIE